MTLILPLLAPASLEIVLTLGACALSILTTFLSTEQDFIHFSIIIAPVGNTIPKSHSFYFNLLKSQYLISTACSNGGGPENCQTNIFSLEGALSNINVYCLNTVGTTNMITENGNTLALYSDNVNVYPDTIALFTTGVVPCTTSLIGWNYRGCYTDNPSSRTLGNRLYVPGSTASMTIEACITVCQAGGYSLAGVEYAGECCKFPSLALLHLHVVEDFF
jgi:hypothetical protein